MEVLDAIYKRRSTRKFDKKEIPEWKIVELLCAGQQAPSVRNGQPWQYIIVRDKERMKKMADLKNSWKPLRYAKCGICMFVNKRLYKSRHLEFFAQDCAAATENILLAATAEDIESLWLGAYPDLQVCNKLKGLLNLPEEMIPFNLIALGYCNNVQNERIPNKKPIIYKEYYIENT